MALLILLELLVAFSIETGRGETGETSKIHCLMAAVRATLNILTLPPYQRKNNLVILRNYEASPQDTKLYRALLFFILYKHD